MKRLITLLILLVTLASCGGGATPTATTEPEAQATARPTRTAGSAGETTPTTAPDEPTLVPTGDDPAETPVETADTGEAATEAPATEAPATDEPATGEPATEEPATDVPATQEPSATTAPTNPPPAPAKPQVRALWVDAFHNGFRTPDQVAKLVGDAKRGNLNTLVVQIRRRGDAFYNSTIEPRAETGDEPAAPVPPGFDPLQALIDEAHAQGIEVHAWIAALPVWHSDPRYQTAAGGHVWRQHGPDAPGRDNWVMMRLLEDGSLTHTYSVDPGHPDAAQYTIDVALDIARNYDVDGVHLDYIRYGEVNEGYNPTAVERFNALFGRSGQPSPSDPQWMQWRRDQVSALVRRMYVELQAVKPQLKLSAATIAWGGGPVAEADWNKTAAFARVMQDWRAWTEEGILDLVIPMNYFRDHVANEQTWFDQWAEWQKNHQYGRHVLAGPGAYTNYIEDTLAQIERALAPSSTGNTLPGIGIYDYATADIYSNDDYRSNATAQGRLPRQPWEYRPDLSELFFTALSDPTTYTYNNNGGQVTVSTEPVFPVAASIPPMPWKESPTTGSLSGRLVASGGIAAADLDGLSVTISGAESRTLISDGNGWFGAIELEPGTYHVTVSARSGRTFEADVGVRSGQVGKVEIAVEP